MKIKRFTAFSEPKKWPFFYGYTILFASIICFFASLPGQTIGVSAFIDPLIKDLGISRMDLSLAYMYGTIFSALSLSVFKIGSIVDNRGVRKTVFFTTIFFGITLFVMSKIGNIQSYLVNTFSFDDKVLFFLFVGGFFFMRFFGQGILGLSSRVVLMKWFIHKRGKVNSIQSPFMSLGMSLTPIAFGALIRLYSWQTAWQIIGIVLVVVISFFLFIFLRNSPEECGLLPDGGELKGKVDDLRLEKNFTLRQSMRTISFWGINLSLSLHAFYMTAVSFHIESIFKTAGLKGSDGLTIFIPMTVIAVIITMISGWLSDKSFFRSRLQIFIIIFLLGIILSTVGIVFLHSAVGYFLLIIGNGVAAGLFSVILNVVLSDYFGRKHLGAIGGVNLSMLVFFSAIGPVSFATSLKLFGSYHNTIYVFFLVTVVLFVFSFFFKKPEYKREIIN